MDDAGAGRGRPVVGFDGSDDAAATFPCAGEAAEAVLAGPLPIGPVA